MKNWLFLDFMRTVKANVLYGSAERRLYLQAILEQDPQKRIEIAFCALPPPSDSSPESLAVA